MATNSVIKSLNALSYEGTFEHTSGGIKVSGTLQTDGNKVLNTFSGSVVEDNVSLAYFNGWGSGDGCRYSFNEISDIEKVAEIAAAVKAARIAIETELAQ